MTLTLERLVLGIILLIAMALLATAQTAIPNNGSTVALGGQEFVVQQHKIVGTLFGKQVWIRVNDTAVPNGYEADCDGGGCWIFIGEL